MAAFLAIAFGAASLAGAFASQYFLGLEPCAFCIYQRWPHAVAALFGIFSMLSARNRFFPCFLGFSGVIYLIGAGIAAYHVGVEQGVFELSAACENAVNADGLTFEQMTEAVMAASNARCDIPALTFAGLSMAAWNCMFSFFAGTLLVVRALLDRRAGGKN
ncbi:MAG: disulfide bond formation protein B [Rickettsiales bacterium]